MTNEELQKVLEQMRNEVELQNKLINDLTNRVLVAERKIRRLIAS